MDMRDIQVGDRITKVNGERLSSPLRVIEVVPDGTEVRLPDTVSGLQRWVYADQHEVEIEVPFTEEEFVIISDALLLIAERLEDQNLPAARSRGLLRKLHRFTTPQASGQLVLRPA